MPRQIDNRRHFVRTLAAGTAATLTGASANAQHGEVKQDPPADAFDAEVDARMALVIARYGAKLDDAAREAVREDVRGLVRRGQRLKETPLDNGDGPALVFHAYRGPIESPPRILPA